MKQILLHVTEEEKVLAVLDEGVLSDISVEKAEETDLVGRVYKGVIRNVVPSINGMFIDIGIGKNGFLRTKDILSKEPHTEGASVLVQVEKDSTETKGPLLTEKISFAGKYAVALLATNYIGISKKIRSEEKRASLRAMARDICPSGMGAIVRTAAEKAETEELRRDLSALSAVGEIVSRRFKVEKAPKLLYRDGDLAVKSLRDYMTPDVESLITDDRPTFQRLRQLAEGDGFPAEKIRCYEGKEPLFQASHVDEQMKALFDREVPLPSGGSLVIDYTEALTAIDVNSGSFQGNMPHGELAFLLNQSAVKEIARQIRLRGIGGIILIDFIDMERKSQEARLVELLKEEVRKDRVKTVVCGMTSLGLVEMTRKRTVHRLWQNYYETCPLCHGQGRILSAESVAQQIIEDLERQKSRAPFRSGILIRCEKEVAHRLHAPDMQARLESLVHHDVIIEDNGSMMREGYSILGAGD